MMTLVCLRMMIFFEMKMVTKEATLEMRVKKAQSRLASEGDLMKYVLSSFSKRHLNRLKRSGCDYNSCDVNIWSFCYRGLLKGELRGSERGGSGRHEGEMFYQVWILFVIQTCRFLN